MKKARIGSTTTIGNMRDAGSMSTASLGGVRVRGLGEGFLFSRVNQRQNRRDLLKICLN